MRCEHYKNPIFAYYNINSLRHKISDIKEFVSKTIPEVLVLAETKIDSSFPNAQFLLDNYYEPSRSDNSLNSGGIIEFIRKGVIRKQLPDVRLHSFENIVSELTFSKSTWFLLSFYRTHRTENKRLNVVKFLQELSNVLNRAILKYDNIIIMGDINIDLHDTKCIGYKELTHFMDTFALRNLIKDKTCYFKGHQSSVDIILTNKFRKFFISKTFELGISDCHKMVTACLRSQIPRLKNKTILYRSFRNFDKELFLEKLRDSLSKISSIYGTNFMYDTFVNMITVLLDKFAPIKKKVIRGNQSRFMNKELSKAIMKRSTLKSTYHKSPNKLNRSNYKRQRNLCVSLKKKAIKNDFQHSTSNIKENSKPFYNLIKPYLTNKGALSSDDIILLESNVLVSNDKKIVDIFNDYYTNIVEYTCGSAPTDIATIQHLICHDSIIDEIIETYRDHPSILRIKTIHPKCSTFSFKSVSESEILNLLRSVDSKKSVGIDTIPPLIIKESAEILARPLTQIINESIKENVFPSQAKIAAILPFFKKDDRLNKKNYRPISILSSISKIFEKVLKNQIMTYMDTMLSPYLSAYRKQYSAQHVLIRLLEQCRKALDNGNFVGAILMDLSKAFDCIPHDLLIAKLQAYGFNRSSLKHIYSYLKGRRQCVKINDIYSKFLTILAGIPQGSILGPILFNIFINDLFYFIEKASLHGFADDHTISSESKELIILKDVLVSETNIAINWLTDNSMIANPSKFQAIVMSKSRQHIITDFAFKDKSIESTNAVKLLGVTIDDKLNFTTHISNICRKAGGQLNALLRLRKYLSHDSKKLAINSFVESNFNYCPLAWHFSTYDSNMKIYNIYKRSDRFTGRNSSKDHISIDLMKIKRLRILAIEVFKTLHNLNPSYMKEIFQKSSFRTSERLKFNIKVHSYNQTRFGKNSLRFVGPMLWNSLPNEVKSITTLPKFKLFMKTWGTEACPHYKRFVSYFNSI